MPMMANITVKKYDGTTDIVYTASNAAGADGTVASWYAPALNGTVASRPTFESWCRWNGPKTARRVEFRGSYPQALTDTNTGLVVVRNQATMTGSFLIPSQMNATDLNEFAAQMTNLYVSILVRDAIRTGTSFT